MLRRLQQLFLLCISLVLIYLIVIRALLTWAQTAPEHFLPFAERITQTQIQVEQLTIEQTWLGFEFQIKNAQIRSDNFQAELRHASGDLNLWFFLGQGWHIGEKLMLDGVQISLKPFQTGSTSNTFSTLKIDQAWSILYQSWQLINLKDIRVSLPIEQHRLALGIDSIQSYRGVKWTIGGVLTLGVDAAEESRIQLKGRFSPPKWQEPLEGSMSFNVLKPVLLAPFYQLMSEEWQSTLPTGALLGDIDLDVKHGELTKLAIRSHAQNLVWPVNDALLPKSFGIDLNWVATNQLKGKASENWQFKIENLRFDKAYVDTISPIYIQLEQNKLLTFKAAEIDYEVVRPVVELFFNRFNYERVTQSVQQLKLVEVSGAIDIVDLNLNTLKLKIPKLTIDPFQNQPGFSVQDLSIEKQQQDLWIKTSNPIPVTAKVIDQGQPMKFKLAEPIHIQFDEFQKKWQLTPFNFQLAQIPMALQASGDSSGQIQLDFKFEPNQLATVKRYLPYSLMSATLQNWLKTALVNGDGIKGAMKLEGNVGDFPFEKGEGIFEVTTEIHHTQLEFQPDWPALSDFSAQLKFSPYQLQIDAVEVPLHPKSLLSSTPVSAKDVKVVIDHLNAKDIAVEIQGSVTTAADSAIQYLHHTPLLTNIGIDEFLKEQLTLTGPIKVDLNSIWIPVNGYGNKTEQVKGQIALNQVEMKLFDMFPVSKMAGSLQFTESSVRGSRLSAKLFEAPAKIQVETHNNQVQILTNSSMASSNSFINGTAPWQAQVNIPLGSNRPIKIYNEIALEPLVFQLPAPLSEAELAKHGRPKKLVSKIEIDDNQLNHDLGLEPLLKVHSRFNLDKQQLDAIQIRINDQSSNQPMIDIGGVVEGQLHSVDLGGWSKTLPELKAYLNNQWGIFFSEDSDIVWHNSHLQVEKLLAFGAEINNLSLNWSSLSDDGTVVMSVQGDEVKATIKKTMSNQFAVNLTHLAVDLPFANLDSDKADANCQLKPALHNHVKSEIDFEGKNIQLNGKKIDGVSFKLTHADTFLNIDQLKVFAEKVNAPFEGNYWFNKEDNTSRLSGSVKTKQVGSMLDFLGFNKGFKGNEMQMGVDLAWSGDVSCFELKQLSGEASFKMKDGVIKDAEPGFARLLGLLSFESLARRLRLNVNDFTDAGLVYDQIEGKGRFDQGLFKINKLELTAPAAKAQVFGQVNLIENALDLKAEVTPSLGSSLPAIAAISGFATPIAGFAAYVFMKYMPFVNEDIITYRYDVTGTLANPKLDVKGPSVELFKFSN